LTLSVLKDTFIVKNVTDSNKWIVYVLFGYYINKYFIFHAEIIFHVGIILFIANCNVNYL